MSVLMVALLETDFAAYAPQRATSNAYVRPRLEVRDRLARLAQPLLDAARAHTPPLDVVLDGSDERPSIWNKRSVTEQWIFLWRSREARAELERLAPTRGGLGGLLQNPTPWDRHAFVGLRLDAERLAVGLFMHAGAWADVETLRARAIDDGDGQRALALALGRLPSGYLVSGEPCGVRALVDALAQAERSQGFLTIERSLSRPEALALGAALADWVREGADALWALYALATYRPVDGPAVVAEALAIEARARAALHEDALAQERAWAERRRAESDEARAKFHAHASIAPGAVLRVRAPVARYARSAKPMLRRADAKPSAPAKRETEGAITPPLSRAAPTALARGARVRITEGPFAGAVGVLLELPDDGLARVSLGALAVRVARESLGPA